MTVMEEFSFDVETDCGIVGNLFADIAVEAEDGLISGRKRESRGVGERLPDFLIVEQAEAGAYAVGQVVAVSSLESAAEIPPEIIQSGGGGRFHGDRRIGHRNDGRLPVICLGD